MTDSQIVLYFFHRGRERRICETRLREDGPGYELIVTDDRSSYVETFEHLAAMLAREHELLQAWRAQGWRDDSERKRRQPS